MKKGIDVSQHNGVIDWSRVKSAGVDFAILRMSYGIENPKQVDKEFERNYAECKRYGIPVGAYHYSYATTVEGAEKEAEFALKLLKDKQFEYPIYYDMEEKSQVGLPKEYCSQMVMAFCCALEQEGYWAGIYSFDSFFQSNLIPDIPKRFTSWVARIPLVDDGTHFVPVQNVPSSVLGMHQFSWKGKIPGIKGDVDLNNCFKDFPSVIIPAGKNGYPKNTTFCVTAKQNRLTKDKAQDVAAYLQKLGMTVIVEEDNN